MRSVAAAIVALLLTWMPSAAQPVGTRSAARPSRIVSLIPAITEMLFAIGAGPQVAAVSSFDRYPPEVQKLPRVGALIDPDIERILSLHPDLVAVYASQTELRAQLERARIPVYVYTHAGLPDVLTTLRTVGARVGHEKAAADLAAELDKRIASVRERVARRARPRTLIVFDRERLALRGIYASGGIGFIHDMLDAAGGANVFADIKQPAVQATTELILARRPDVVLELRGGELDADTRQREIAVWRTLASLPAVRTGRIFFIDQQRTVVPGPRIAQAIELIARTLHPEAFK